MNRNQNNTNKGLRSDTQTEQTERFIQLNAKVRRTDNGYAITIFVNDGLLEASRRVRDGRGRY